MFDKSVSATAIDVYRRIVRSRYLEHEVGSTRVPLLMTRDLLFSNAAPLEATVLAFVASGSYTKIRADAAAAYAGVQMRPVNRIFGVCSNPSDRR